MFFFRLEHYWEMISDKLAEKYRFSYLKKCQGPYGWPMDDAP
jgi:hypothetical protein